MAKRITRAKKSIESLQKAIEKHFNKIKSDIANGDLNSGRYHIKEIDKSLIKALEIKMEIIGKINQDIVENYKRRLDEIKKSLY